MTKKEFKSSIIQGVPKNLPEEYNLNTKVDHAPKRKNILSKDEKKLALSNALRYFPKNWHKELSINFLEELEIYGRIYMYRFKPKYKIYARHIEEYPGNSNQAKAIMLMIQNNLDPEVAQFPDELITYGGNGAVFQNWAQYLICMSYLSHINDNQTLVMYSGHPLGIFPSSELAPRVVVTNGMMIPNYSKKDDWEKYNALGVTQYGQMTAGSYMYIGPQGIVHGTAITIKNALNKTKQTKNIPLFVSSGLGGMSGAQPKAAKIVKVISVIAEMNLHVIKKRHQQGWVDEIYDNLKQVCERIISAQKTKEIVSIAFHGNIVDLWKVLYEKKIFVDLGSDQTSLHNPFSGGYFPQSLNLEEGKQLMVDNPELFKKKVQKSLINQVDYINKHHSKGTYFFDYGNAFLLESSRAGADVWKVKEKEFKHPSYVQDIMGPMCFDFGFGPFRWVCTSGKEDDLHLSDKLAITAIKKQLKNAPKEIKIQLEDNLNWIENAQKNNLVVGSKARILYADSEGRIEISKAFNKAIKEGEISAPIILGRDHHDVSGTDSPFRETSNIYDGSKFTADMAIHNCIGDSFRGASWVSIHNGGGVGWGEVINGGFGMVLDGSEQSDENIESMLFWDVNNGIARRSWAKNPNALFAIKRAMEKNKNLKITLPSMVDKSIINNLTIK